jgi:hypothetical protein
MCSSLSLCSVTLDTVPAYLMVRIMGGLPDPSILAKSKFKAGATVKDEQETGASNASSQIWWIKTENKFEREAQVTLSIGFTLAIISAD